MRGEGPLWREAASSSNRQTKNPRGTATFSGRRVDASATFPLVTGSFQVHLLDHLLQQLLSSEFSSKPEPIISSPQPTFPLGHQLSPVGIKPQHRSRLSLRGPLTQRAHSSKPHTAQGRHLPHGRYPPFVFIFSVEQTVWVQYGLLS